MRIRITFAKTDAMRFTSHLDLHKTWERTFRRAGLPLAYSQGFHPQPRINLASALPLGFTGNSEIIDAWLEKDVSLPDIQAALEEALPPGVRIHQIEDIDPKLPALQTELLASEYQVTLLIAVPDLPQRIAGVLAQTKLLRERRGKVYDLRPLIHEIQGLPDNDQGAQRFCCQLSARQSATGRPEELLAALEIPPEEARIERVRLIFADAHHPAV